MTTQGNKIVRLMIWIFCCVCMINCTESFTPTTITIDPGKTNITPPVSTTTPPTTNPTTDPANPNNGGAATGSGGGTNTGSGSGTASGSTGGAATASPSGGMGMPLSSASANSYSDSPGMVYLENGIVKVGLNSSLGGAITYLSPSHLVGSYYNMINNFDLGRQIQQAFYADPVTSVAPYPNEGHIWNPNQAGDIFKNLPPAAIETRKSGNTIYIKARPMIWALRNTPCDCFMETWVELQDNVVKYRGRFTNERKDKTFYNSHYQSLPAVFLNGAFNNLATYTGDMPFTNAKMDYYDLTKIDPKLGEVYYNTTENWAVLANNADYGIGLWAEDIGQFVCGGNFGTGKYESDNGIFSMIPVQLEHLDHNIVYDFKAELIVGKTQDIRQYIYRKHSNDIRKPNYYFVKDRQHWTYINNLKDTGMPIQNEELVINPTNTGGQMFSPHVLWRASDIPKIYIRMAHKTKAKNARLFWRKYGNDRNFDDTHSITFDIIPDGEYHTYELDMTKNSTWSDAIIQLLLAPFGYGAVATTDEVKIKYISYKPE